MISYTDAIFSSECPFDNPYQGTDKRVLFVCSAGLLHSATGARIYAKKYNTRAAGSSSYALIPVTESLLLWAKEVVFVNEENYEVVKDKFDLNDFPCSVIILDIPDQYDHMNPKLIAHFVEQYGDYE